MFSSCHDNLELRFLIAIDKRLCCSGKVFLRSTRKVFQVERKSVGYIKFIFEAYDGIATITTIDPFPAKIEINIAPGSEIDVDKILDDLHKDILIRDLNQ
jgi:hypothetical protein